MSLPDKAREYSLSIDDLKRCCRPEHAEEIAKDFSEWRLASSRLKINPDEVSVIERNDRHDEAVQRKKFLEKWMKNNGDDATYLMLLEALINNGRMDLVESLLKLIKDQDARDDGLASDSGGEVKEEDMRFLCGCGNCTLVSFLKNGCPHPWEKSRYPLLNIKKMNKKQKLELLSRLDKEAEIVSEEFGSLMVNVYDHLKDTDVKKIVLFLLPQQKFSGMKDEDRKELLANLRKATTTGDALTLLTENFISWFNHPLLGSIAKKFVACKADYDEYVDKFLNPYMKRCLFEIPSNIGQEFKGSGKFILKVTTLHLEHKDKTKAEILLPLRRHVSEVCGIAIDAFDICSYEKGCLQVTVAAPLALLEEIFPLSDDALNLLSSFSYEGARIKAISFGEHYHPVPIKQMSTSTPASILKHTTALTDMINKFASLVVELYINIKERLPEAKQYLLGSVYVFQQRTDQGQLFQNDAIQKEIEKASTAADLMVILNSFWSFYNYFLLSKMIRKFCIDNDVVRRNLDEYVNSLEELSPARYPPIVQPYTNEECFHTDLLIVEVEKLNCINGDTLSQIHSSVARWLTIESHALLLKRIRRITNKLEYLIPECITTAVPVTSSLLDAPVLSISFGKTVTICCKEKKSSGESDIDSGFHSGSTDDETCSYFADESESEHNHRESKRSKRHATRRGLKMESFPSSPPHEKTSDFKYNPNAPAFTPQGDVHFPPGLAQSYLPHDATSNLFPQEDGTIMTLFETYDQAEHHTRLKTCQELEKWKMSFKSRLENTALQETEVEAELAVGNYRNKFYYLLCYEESAHIRLLGEKCDGEYTFILMGKNWNGYTARLSGMDGNKVQYATQASEAVFLSHTITGEEICKADILQINYHNVDDDLAIHLSTSAMKALKQKMGKDKCKIYAQFEVKHHYFDTLHKAVVNIPHSMILKIIPLRKSIETTSSLLPRQHSTNPLPKSLSLDDSVQNQALNLILDSSPSVPVIVSGPFGSGKTRLLGRAAYEFGENGLTTKTQMRILICAHHYSTIESITGVLAQGFQKKQGIKVVQILRNDFKRETSNIVYSSMQSFTDDVKQGRHIGDPVLILITTYFSSLQVANMLSSKEFCFRFTHILLDEAAQVREPEAIAALSLGDENTKVVIAGDSKQDSPRVVVLGDIARDNGLKISLLERLERRYDEIGGERYLIHLDVNYRCHPMLTKFLSDVVYKYPIKSAAAENSPEGQFFDAKACSCLFYCCHIFEDVSEAATVAANLNAMEAEAKAAISWLEKLEPETKESSEDNNEGTLEDNVCVVSSFRKQLNIIKKEMKGRFERVSLKPTYTIQGHEYKAVIICAYEPLEADGSSTDSTKTLVQPGIFNTVVSRSKQQVIVVGNPFRLLDLEKRMNTNPKCWNEYIKLCLKNDTMLYSDDIEQSKIDQLLRAKVGINDRLPPQRSLSAVQHKTSTPPFLRAKSETPSSQMVKSKSKKKTSVGGISDVISQEQKQTIATISDTVHQDRKLKQTKATKQTESRHKKNAISLEKSSTKKSKSLEQSVEAKSLEKRRKQTIEQASGIKDKDIKTGQYPPLPMNTATACVHAVIKQPMYTEYRKPVLPDDTVSTTSKHQKKKKQKKPSIEIHIPFYHSHSEPPLEVAPETMANKSTNLVMPGVSFADKLKATDISKPKKAVTK